MKRWAINFPMLTRVMGVLLLIEAAFMLVPLAVTLIYGDGDTDAFLKAMLCTAGAGALTFLVKPTHHNMGKREGFLLTALVWVLFSLFGMLPFMWSRTPLDVSAAFFEAMSGFTTTGATVMTDIDNLSHGIHMWRSLMQWIGGMGIILFTLAVLPMLNSSGGIQMFNAEVTGITHEKLRPRVSSTAKHLWILYGVLTAALVILYWVGPMNFFDSMNHALTTLSTGGFSTKQNSLGEYGSVYIKCVATFFMFLGGVNFALLFRAASGEFAEVWKNQTFKLYVLVVFVALLLFMAAFAINDAVPHTFEAYVIDPLFQIVSTMTSTGYTASNFETWGVAVLGMHFVLMFFCASAGSTSGGAKLDRAYFLWKNTRNEIYRCVYPNHIMSTNVNGVAITPELAHKVLAFLCLYCAGIIIGGVLLLFLGMPLTDSFFASFSCMGNVGLGAGVTGFAGSYDAIPAIGKWVMSFLMLTGRLEIYTVMVLIAPGFWRK